ncbi:MAG: PAS domain S-box protein [Caenispirillum bisanense]|nr:PAS domain S-box protein [Caenispirillum bisanense]
MTTPAEDEAHRLARLRAYAILDTPPEESFDRVTRLAARLFDVPIAAVSLVDADRQWFKSVFGLDVRQTHRDVAFCAHTIQGHDVLEVPDATADARFVGNTLVTGDPGIRFYAGAPLLTADGVALGSLCIIDRKPRALTEEQRQVLVDLAAMAMDAMELRNALRDATAREEATLRAQQALGASELRQRAILETAVDAILTIDAAGIIQSVNAATVRLFGYAESEMVGRNVGMLMPEPHAAGHDGYMRRYLGSGVPHIIGIGREVPGRRKDGTIFPCDLAVSRVDLDGEVFFTGVLRDLSARVAAEQALVERNRLLGLAEELSLMGHWRFEMDGLAVTWSDGMYRIFGRSRQDFVPTIDGVVDCHPEGDRPMVRAAVKRAIDTASGFSIDTGVTLPSGEVRDVAILGRCEVAADGTVLAVFGVMQDITDRKRAEAALKLSEERLQRATAFAEIGTWDWNLRTNDIYWSERMAELFGYPGGVKEVAYESAITRTHPHDRHRVQAAITACIEQGRVYDIEHRVVWPDGTIRWVHGRGDVVRDADGRPVRMLGVIRDITRNKAAEVAVQESQRRLRVAIDNITDGFILIDADDRIVLWNERMTQLYPRLTPYVRVGVPFEETVRAGVRDGQYLNAIGREEAFIAERMARHRLPREFYEERLIDSEGRPRWVRVAETALPGGGRVGIRTDITELRLAQEEAERANEAKSAFLSSMSHELRTPLNAILGFAQLLEASRKDPLTDKQKSHVQHILKGGQHLLDLINEVLDLARIEAGKLTLSIEDISPADVIDECLSITETLAERRGIAVQRAFALPLPGVRADYTRLKQVLLNLLSNAVKYNREEGRITLAVGPGAPGMLRFAVTDTGRGIPADKFVSLFEPFNRLGAETTEVEGTGIGLTITRELTERMGGTIGVESEVGVGSTFWVEMPLSEARLDLPVEIEALGDATADASAGPSLRVLYVEDNPANMRLMEEVMEELGNVDLRTAHTAELGIELAVRERPDLILMDVNLPGMDGFQALAILREQPETRTTPIIALTANATASSIQKGIAAGFTAYLTKPVVIPQLMQAIRDAVEGRTA